ncbi:TonB-dependent receptor [Sphingobium sp. TCM1]|uniref:TonB-dependent receptor n=1 Tax=Sphingobium sp. TCM1 TaxID=453246 RepID=UPI0007F4509E|nr:TonB-dependent receptor [Sphingobium sp. TCM1]OAN53479.1 hypothetical protein A7Q26_05510 [Sphingobium sp. TCM1]
MGSRFRCALLAAVAIGTFVPVAPVLAADERRIEYNIEAGDLGEALKAVSRLSGKEIIFNSEAVLGKTARRLHGRFTADEAVQALLEGSGLTAQFRKEVIIIRGRAEPSGNLAYPSTVQSDIVVTGSRIRGATPTSPVISMSRQTLTDAGFTNLGDAVRSIPQNFGGGQNPGVAGGGLQGGNNQNVTSSSTLNLRGLGPDATLTLLNGHRLPYDAVYQGIDIASIPLAAVDRIEVVADGASAIYGSDAVGGVANVILRPDYSGLSTSARYGGSTDGGNQQQQYSAVGGAVWQGGGLIGVFDYNRSTAILAKDRDYTRTLDGSSTLVPAMRQISAILAGHQQIGTHFRLSVDSTYNRRTSRTQSPSTVTADYSINGALSLPRVESFSVSPRLEWSISPSWHAYATGTYGVSDSRVTSAQFASRSQFLTALVHYRDTLATGEAGIEAHVFTLPGGDVQLAAGAGYRSNSLDVNTQTVTPVITTVLSDFTANRDSYYGFAEINVPLISPALIIPAVYRLSLNAAVRYEDYPGIDRIATPKLGILYAPTEDIDLKGSWGRSFKAPTLYQQFNYKAVSLKPASAYGATAFPPTATVLQTSGGNADSLRPEHASTWTASLALHPHWLPHAQLEVSYFHIAYRDRIITPLQSSLGALSNPIYADIITFNPSAAQIAAALANAPAGLSNQTGNPYDPASVVAILDNRQRNSARQRAHGVDINGRYTIDPGQLGTFNLQAQVSYLSSRQILIEGQPSLDLAGEIFNPPHWRARAGFDWHKAGYSAAAYFNRTGGEIDNRLPEHVPVGGLSTIDIAGGYTFGSENAVLRGLSVSASIFNLLNAKPARIRQAYGIDPSYDSNNVSAVGRFMSLTVTKKW